MPIPDGKPVSFRRIPTVLSAQELLDKAFLRGSKISAPAREALDRVRGTETARLRSAQNALDSTLARYVARFPSFEQLPPFYRDLVKILVDVDRTRKALGALDWARARINEVGDEAAMRMKRLRVLDEIRDEKRHAYGRISSFVRQIAKDLEHLNGVRNVLRQLPEVDPEARTIVIAGYPNVGKSSLLRRLSNAEPEVAPYPFTTKGVVIGILEHRRERYQVIDTPGLLDRPLEERNVIEVQAVLALTHLADVVVFLLDPSGHCGYTPEAQERLLAEARRLFPDTPFVVAENKVDLPEVQERAPGAGDRLRLSTLTGEGVPELVEAAVEATRARRAPEREA